MMIISLKNTIPTMQNQEAFYDKRVLNLVRLVIGLVQGIVLYIFYSAVEDKWWLAKHAVIFNPLLMIFCFVPFILIHGMGNMRRKMLIIWSLVVAILLASLAYYDTWRLLTPTAMPSLQLFFAVTLMLFIAHALVVGSDNDRKFMARYTTYFDVAWKLWVQFVLSLIFLGIFWSVLQLGAALFALIKITFFVDLIQRSWFSIPVSTLAIALALNVTDVRPSLVRGVRTLILVLLSWLLPLMALITAGFLCSLIFTGFSPLWRTSYATLLLLVAAASSVIFINTAYQDGNPEKPTPKISRYAARLAALTLVPTIAIAVYALSLRVGQYGWTIDRIWIGCCIIVAACYALGYALAALKPGAWLQFIEVWNFGTALLVIIILIALLTPIADPARLSISDQMARLQAGKIAPQQFDFSYLRVAGERFGYQALLHLQQTSRGSQANYIRDHATAILENKRPGIKNFSSIYVPTVADKKQQITMHTPREHLPDSFLKQNWQLAMSYAYIPACLKNATQQCDAWLIDLKGDGKKAVVLLDRDNLVGFQQDEQQVWQPVGTWSFYGCKRILNAARAGQFKTIPSAWPDIEVMGLRLQFTPRPTTGELPGCST